MENEARLNTPSSTQDHHIYASNYDDDDKLLNMLDKEDITASEDPSPSL